MFASSCFFCLEHDLTWSAQGSEDTLNRLIIEVDEIESTTSWKDRHVFRISEKTNVENYKNLQTMKIDGLGLNKLSCIEFCFASKLCPYFSVDFLSQLKHNKDYR